MFHIDNYLDNKLAQTLPLMPGNFYLHHIQAVVLFPLQPANCHQVTVLSTFLFSYKYHHSLYWLLTTKNADTPLAEGNVAG